LAQVGAHHQNRSLELPKAPTMSTQQLITGVEVWQPNGNVAYRADQAEVDRLLRTKAAKPQYGRDKKLRALRLKVAIPVRVVDSEPMEYRGVAPAKAGPARWFWWEHAVYPDMRPSPHRSAGQTALRAVRAEERAAKESAVHAERIEARRA